MKNSELYFKTIKILTDAYRNDTLVHGNCAGCAVGNLISANMGYKVCRDRDDFWWFQNGHTVLTNWSLVFMTTNSRQSIDQRFYSGGPKKEIDSTGYSFKDLAKIEYAFETAPRGTSKDDWMFNGLMAVVDVLNEIHENTDKEISAETKLQFQKAESQS